MKILSKLTAFILTVLLVVGCCSFAHAADGGKLRVSSEQSLFEPFEINADEGCYYDLTVKLRADKKIVNSTLKLGFDSDYLLVTDCAYGSQISGAVTNITEQRQLEENNVISLISSGKYYDYTNLDVLVTYQVFVKSLPAQGASLSVDFVTLTANNTIIADGVEDLDVNGDVSLISKSKLIGDGFGVDASLGQRLGDVDGNGVVNINDATAIQLYLTDKLDLSENQLVAANTYNDSKVSIRDVTMIQLWLLD